MTVSRPAAQMRRFLRGFFPVLVVLAVAVLAAIVAYQAVARDREYQRLLARGDAALSDDQTFGAIEAYSGAIALRPDSMLAHLRRGETYQRRGDLDAAAHDFRAAAALDPTSPRPLEGLGNVLYQMQRYPLAADAYESALALDDRSARLSYKLALSRYRAGELEAAIAAAQRTAQLSDSAGRGVLPAGDLPSRPPEDRRGAARLRAGRLALAGLHRRARGTGRPLRGPEPPRRRARPAADHGRPRPRARRAAGRGRPGAGARRPRRAGRPRARHGPRTHAGPAARLRGPRPRLAGRRRGPRRSDGAQQVARSARTRRLRSGGHQRGAHAVWPGAAARRPARTRRADPAAGDDPLPCRSVGVPLLRHGGRTAEPPRRRPPRAHRLRVARRRRCAARGAGRANRLAVPAPRRSRDGGPVARTGRRGQPGRCPSPRVARRRAAQGQAIATARARRSLAAWRSIPSTPPCCALSRRVK